MDKDDFLKLLTKKLADGLTSNEQLDYDLYLLEHKEHKDMTLLLEKFYRKPMPASSTDLDRLNSIWEVIDKNNDDKFKKKRKYNKVVYLFGSIAAALVILFLFGSDYFHSSSSSELIRQTSGYNRMFITLDDGSKVTLDKNSTLSYNCNFGKDNRELLLDGTAFFDVAKDTVHPMYITIGDWKVNVVGTSFTIKPILSGDESELFLYDGKVKLFHIKTPHKIFSINPGEKVKWTRKGGIPAQQLVINKATIEELKANKIWVQDSIIFKNQKLKDLKGKIEEKYNVRIIFENKQLMDKKFSGTITNLKINELLKILKTSYPFEYEIRDSVILLR